MLTILALMGIKPDEILRPLVGLFGLVAAQAPTDALQVRARTAEHHAWCHYVARSDSPRSLPELPGGLSLAEIHQVLGELARWLDAVGSDRVWWAVDVRPHCLALIEDLAAEIGVPPAARATQPAPPEDSRAVDDLDDLDGDGGAR